MGERENAREDREGQIAMGYIEEESGKGSGKHGSADLSSCRVGLEACLVRGHDLFVLVSQKSLLLVKFFCFVLQRVILTLNRNTTSHIRTNAEECPGFIYF